MNGGECHEVLICVLGVGADGVAATATVLSCLLLISPCAVRSV